MTTEVITQALGRKKNIQPLVNQNLFNYSELLERSAPSLKRLAWKTGTLQYKLHPYQDALYTALTKALEDRNVVKYTVNCSRRYGKSFVLCLIAIERALRKPGAQVRFAAPTAKALRKITLPIMKIILDDCPATELPRYSVMDSYYRFPNDSEIHFAGTDNQNYENLRGTASDLNIIDEAAFCSELDYIMRSILIPQTLTTGAKTLLASTPPPTPAHDFFYIAQECKLQGAYSEFDVYQNKSLDPETIDIYAKESGGYESSTFKREYLCQFVVDDSLSIVPEWRDEFVAEYVKDGFSPFMHRYTAMDLGVKDLTAILFATYDFRRGILYVEDEAEMNGPQMTTPKLAALVTDTEKRVYGNIQPFIRVSDNNNLLLLQDLGSLHGCHFYATNKDSLDAMVNEVRILVGEGRLRVDPKCQKLIGGLKYGVFDSKRKEFARTTAYGHFDHLAALVYLIRNLDRQTNPVPAMYNLSDYTHYVPEILRKSDSASGSVLKNLFKEEESWKHLKVRN